MSGASVETKTRKRGYYQICHWHLFVVQPTVSHFTRFACRILSWHLALRARCSAVYGEITANEVLSAKNILAEMLTGSNNAVLRAMIRKHLIVGCDEFIGGAVRPIVKAAIGNTMDIMRDEAVDSIMSDLSETMAHAEKYTQKALDMQNTLTTRMSALPSRQFERLLHPVFEEDEWKLVLMGGVLGVFIGAIQAYFIN